MGERKIRSLATVALVGLITASLMIWTSCGGARLSAPDAGAVASDFDARSSQRKANKPVSIPDAAPRTGGVPLEVHLWDDGSYDPDGEIVKWEWNFSDPHEGKGGWHDFTASEGEAWHTYKHPGTQVAHLRVTDNDGNKDVAFVKIEMAADGDENEDPGGTVWPMFGCDAARTRLSPNIGAQTSNLKWTLPLGSPRVWSSPAVGTDGTIYVGSAYGTNNLFAVNPDGSLQWSFTCGNAVRSSPAIGADGTIYFGSDDNRLYALNPDGSLKWSFTTGGDVFSSPAIGVDGTVYVGSDDKKLYALSPDGSLTWSYATGSCIRSSPAVGADGTIYAGSYDYMLYALDPNGALKWTYTTGSLLWSSPAVAPDGTIYVGSWDKRLHAVNPDGTPKWAYVTKWQIHSSPAIGADGTIYLGSDKFYAINPDGSLKWTYPMGSVYSSPAVGADGTIYVGSTDSRLYAISAEGALKWAYACQSWVESSPALGADGTVYICDYDKLLAFGPSS